MKDSNKKQKTMKIPIILSLVLSISIIILIFIFTFNADTFNYLSSTSIRYEFFVVAVFLNIITWVLWSLRLKVLSNACENDFNISLWSSLKIIITNLFLAGITPSMAGGEPVRIYLLKKEGLNVGSATASVLGERLIDALFILICVPFAFFIIRERISIGLIRWGLLVGVVFFILFFILIAYSIKNPKKTKSFLIFITNKLKRVIKKDSKTAKKIIDRINCEVDNFHSSMVFFVGEGKKAFIIAGILTVFYWSVGFMIPSMLLLGLGLEPFFIESYAAQVLLIVIIMMPTTPGSSGMTELGVGGLYTVLIGSSLIGVFVLLFRLITYHMNLIAGAIFQYKVFKSVASFSLSSIKKEK